ncbi:MAG TPA: ATP-binding cassette domain-containing protein [Actinobacteria bacterium]|nr:ATP-binding cassette domain-containing protein [Actinomycetota bacterium]
MADNIVIIKDLIKKYSDFVAVDGINLEIQAGELFGLLGPNGAGKTTTISIISCLLKPASGDVFVGGYSVKKYPTKAKVLMGVVPQDIALYPTLTALENLNFWGRMYGLSGALLKERVEEALELAGLIERTKERVQNYSGGMKRRLNIAIGILHHPKVLLMDEPTVGIDPQSRNHILETVKRLNRAGTAIIYTSHYMEEVEILCDKVGIIDHGKIIAMGTADELKKLIGDEHAIIVQAENVDDDVIDALNQLRYVDCVNYHEDEIEVLSKHGGRVLSKVVSVLNQADVHINSIDIKEPNLEAVFLHLTGKSLRD